MNPRQTIRPLIAGFSTLALAIGSSLAVADGELLISIPPGPAPKALEAWVDQTGLQLLYDAPVIEPWRTHGVAGTLRPLEALDIMLAGTPIAYAVADRHTVYLSPGSHYCQPWLSPEYAPLPPCVQMPEAMRGARL